MRSRFLTTDPTIAIGVVISIVVSLTLVFTGQDGIASLLVGLLVTTITLLIDVINRINGSERKILDASILSSAVVDDPLLLSEVSDVIQDYKKVKQWGNRLFANRANEVLLDCRNEMQGLAEGQMLIDEGKFQFNYGDRAKSSVKVVISSNPERWNTKYGENLIRANKQAIERGVKFTHLWIQEDENLLKYKNILFQLQDIGMDVRVALPGAVPSNLIEHYRIVDDQKLIKLELGGDRRSRRQRIFIRPDAVEGAINDFNALLKYTQPLNSYFANLQTGKNDDFLPKE
jgi:hypothetical protein